MPDDTKAPVGTKEHALGREIDTILDLPRAQARHLTGLAGEKICDAVRLLIGYAGDRPERPGVLETPSRFLAAWDFYTQGYRQNPADVFKVFEDGAEQADEMVLLRDIPLFSLCEHHLAPFFGTADVAYIPNRKIVGLSKIPRLIEIFSRRLQVQERLTNQIADAMDANLSPLGVGVVIHCRHLCMEMRGVQKAGVITTTSAVRGVFKTKPEARAEFLSLIHNGR